MCPAPMDPCTTHHSAKAEERSKWVEVQGHPRTPTPGIMLSRAHYSAPSLQLGVRGPPRRLHGVSAELEEASWATKNSRKNQRAVLVTPGDLRAAVAAKRSCPQAARGVAALAPPLCSDSPGGGATSSQGRPAWVLLFYGAKRVSDTGGHDPCTGFLPLLMISRRDDVVTREPKLRTRKFSKKLNK